MKKILLIIACLLLVGCNEKYNSSDDFYEIDYEIDNEFGKDETSFFRYYNYSDNEVYCNISVEPYDKDIYDNKEKWFKDIIRFNLNDKVSELKEIDVNDNKVLYIDKTSDIDTDYYYGFESSNFYYLIEYNIHDYENGDRTDIDTNKCFTYKEEFIKGIKVK